MPLKCLVLVYQSLYRVSRGTQHWRFWKKILKEEKSLRAKINTKVNAKSKHHTDDHTPYMSYIPRHSPAVSVLYVSALFYANQVCHSQHWSKQFPLCKSPAAHFRERKRHFFVDLKCSLCLASKDFPVDSKHCCVLTTFSVTTSEPLMLHCRWKSTDL